MKKIIIPLIFFACVTISCNDLFDLRTNGTITMDEVFTDRNRTRGYLSACYDNRPGLYLHSGAFTDDAEDSENKSAYTAYDYWYNTGLSVSNFSSFNLDGNIWTPCYTGIRKCNIFIANIEDAPIFATQQEKAGWKAQAHTLRAFYYLNLIKRYGSVPIILEAFDKDYNYVNEKKSPVGEVVRQILTDCDIALRTPSSDDFSWDVKDRQWNIMTKATAWAIKSQAVTYAVSPLFNDGIISMEEALDITKDALSNCLQNGYELWTEADGVNGYNAYAAYFLYNPDDNRAKDKETIYGGSRVTAWSLAGLPIIDGVSKAGPCPTQDLVDAYEMNNGEAPIIGYSDANRLEPVINPLSNYDENDPYKNRDPRFYATIFYNGSKRGTTDIFTYEGGNCGISETNIKNTPTGYYLRKYAHDNSTRTSNSDGYIRMIRLPELFYNFAEIAYQVKGPDEKINIGNGLLMSACDAVSAVRTRVGMPPFPAAMSKEQFEKKYRNERRIEYAMDQERYFDLRRWKIMKEKTTFVTGMRIVKDGENYVYHRFRFDSRTSSEDKYLLYPINLEEVNKMLKITGVNWQNPGW